MMNCEAIVLVSLLLWIKLVPAEEKDFAHLLFDVVNNCRATHQVSDLVFEGPMSVNAAKRAEELAKNDQIVSKSFEQNGGYGETTCVLVKNNNEELSPCKIAQRCVETWKKESQNYDFSNPGFSQAASNFTEMVWDDTYFFGGGWARSSTGNIYVVAFYSPPGNIKEVTEFKGSVLKEKKTNGACYKNDSC